MPATKTALKPVPQEDTNQALTLPQEVFVMGLVSEYVRGQLVVLPRDKEDAPDRYVVMRDRFRQKTLYFITRTEAIFLLAVWVDLCQRLESLGG